MQKAGLNYLIFLAVCAAFLQAQTQKSAMPDRQVEGRVDTLLRQMTLLEKIGQLNQIGAAAFLQDPEKPEDVIRKGHAGSILWAYDAETIQRMQKIAVEESRLHIPLLVGLDVIHGYRTIFPMPLALAASWDPALVERVQTVAAREASAVGINWTFAPMVDIARDARWGRIIEGAGEDPYLGSAMARAQVRGIQGPFLGSPEHMLACAKHFAGYGAADGGRDYESAYLSDSQLWNVYLPPFRAALEAGAGTFMSAYMDLNDVPATGNKFLLRDVLRNEWGFQGFVVSDAFSIRDLQTHGFARDPRDAAFRAFTAGVSMDMASKTLWKNLPGLVENGSIPVSDIDDAVRPILRIKFRMGLFERPSPDPSKAAAILQAPEHREVARVAAQRSAVLLRNEGRLLPLKKDAYKSIAVIGPLADTRRELLSFWAGTANDTKEVVTVLEGIRAKAGAGVRVEHAAGVEIRVKYPSMVGEFLGAKQGPEWPSAKSAAEFQNAVELAARSDAVVLVMGENPFMSGELASQSTLHFPGRQQELMEAVVKTGKPVVLVLVNGRPLNIVWASQHVPAILETWHPGVRGGTAIADLLFGDADPGGKLPVTWPRSVGQLPAYYAHNLTQSPETAKEFTSRFWDESSAPLYPFGFGLAYTDFSYSNLRLKQNQVKLSQAVEATVDVTNTGDRPGEEVVQLYIHQRAGSASRPIRELKGFERIRLASKEKRTVQFKLGKDELSYWSPQQRKWVQETEAFDIWIGGNSTATLHDSFEVKP